MTPEAFFEKHGLKFEDGDYGECVVAAPDGSKCEFTPLVHYDEGSVYAEVSCAAPECHKGEVIQRDSKGHVIGKIDCPGCT